MSTATSAVKTTVQAVPQRGVVASGRGRRYWWRTIGWRHVVGLIALVFALFPILFLVSASLNPLGSLSSTSLIPRHAGFGNFTKLFHDPRAPYVRWYANTLLICGASALLNVFLGACGAYAFSRFRFRGRRSGLLGVLLVQMFPNFIAVVALYLVFIKIGNVFPGIGLNTPWALILIYLGGAMGVNTWLIKGYLDTIPVEIDESARVDGASHAQIFFQITLRLAAPILAVTGLLAFIISLNEILIANLFLTDNSQKTLAVGLFGLISNQRNTEYGEFAAGSLLAAAPVVILFMYLQRFIVSGLTSGSVKG
jgi:arabinogalactan oligomer / maltooligosaccharide transport system permease protein